MGAHPSQGYRFVQIFEHIQKSLLRVEENLQKLSALSSLQLIKTHDTNTSWNSVCVTNYANYNYEKIRSLTKVWSAIFCGHVLFNNILLVEYYRLLTLQSLTFGFLKPSHLWIEWIGWISVRIWLFFFNSSQWFFYLLIMFLNIRQWNQSTYTVLISSSFQCILFIPL